MLRQLPMQGNYRAPSNSPHARLLAFLLFIFFLLPHYSVYATPESPTFTEMLLLVSLNDQESKSIDLFLLSPKNELLINDEELQKWSVAPPKATPITYLSHRYYFLRDLKGATYQLDRNKMTLAIHLPANLFQPNHYTATDKNKHNVTVTEPGVFINYDTNVQYYGGQSQLSGLLETGYFKPGGILTSDFLLQRKSLNDQLHSLNKISSQLIRLNTAWQTDDVEKMRTFRIGDSYSSPGLWGRSAGFGGIQIASNFATQPEFITFPLPSTTGEAVVPSTVDLYVNNALVSKQNVNAGPFTINTIPVVTGLGTLKVVTTDILGRQQVVNMPYYASNNLLKQGLHNYSIDLGLIREDFSVRSNSYKKPMIVGTDRYGVTDRFTQEWHAELLSKQQALGFSGNYLLSNVGVISGSLVGSHGHNKGGGLGMIGFQREAFGGISMGFNAQAASQRFTQLGLQEGQLEPNFTAQAFLGVPLHKNSSLGFSYTAQNNRDQPSSSLLGASYNQQLFSDWSFNLNGITNLRGQRTKAVYLIFTRAINERTMANFSINRQNDDTQLSTTISRSLPIGSGWGYSLVAQSGVNKHFEAQAIGQNSVGTYSLSAAKQGDQKGYRFQANGAMVWMGGDYYFTRSIGSGFGIVQVPGYSGIGVYQENQIVSYTNTNGSALLPNLLPYQNNTIRIDPTKLPLDAQVDSHKLIVTPAFKSGVIMKFPVKVAQAGLLQLKFKGADWVPAGAEVSVEGQTQKFYVGNEGELYLTGLAVTNKARAVWDDIQCSFTLAFPKPKEPVPNLGIINCQ